MSIKLVSYDLGGPETGESYRKLSDAIHRIGDCIKPLESFYLLSTPLPSDVVADRLGSQLDYNDKLIVVEAGECVAAWRRVDPDTYSWIMHHR